MSNQYFDTIAEMPADVNPLERRRYESPRRREQAAATRRQILGAAQRLFEAHGYAATTMAAIADEAGVASKTVYLAFETKSGLVRALVGHAPSRRARHRGRAAALVSRGAATSPIRFGSCS